MTIASSKNTPRNTYTATAGQTVFNIGFEFFNVNDIKVYKNGTLLSYNASPSTSSQYKVTGTASSSDDAYEFGSGGTITLGAGATLNDSIVIIRDIAIERLSDFPTSGSFDITSLNTQLDTLVSMMSEQDTLNSRSVRLADTDVDSATITLPNVTTRASKVMAFDASGNIVTNISSSGLSTLATITSDITTVAGIAADVSQVASDSADVQTVATNIASINTVSTNIADVITVANDLNEAISEVETVANDLNEAVSEIDTVGNNITYVQTVGDSTNIANINTVAGQITPTNNISTLAGLNTELSAIYNIRTNITNVDTNSANVNLVAGQISPTNNISTLAGLNAEISALYNIRTDITGVNTISADVTAVANDATDIGTVATNLTGSNTIGTVATNINDIITVATDTADIQTLADIEDGTVATNAVSNAANNSTNITTVAGQISPTNNISTVAIAASNIATVAGQITPTNNISTVASINSYIPAVANNNTDISIVAGQISPTNNISTVAGLNAEITSLGAISGDITTLAGFNSADISTVAGQISPTNNIQTIAGANANISTIASNLTGANTIGTVATDLSGSNTIGTVATNITDVQDVAANISGVNSFAERYRVAASDPTTNLDAGDLAFNTTGNVFKYYDGSSWQGITAGGITDVVQDSTPQLGGNLDLNSSDITGTGNVNITGNVSLTGTVDGRDIATDGTKLDTIATSATANPNAIDNLVEDTTPQLGGNLDLNGNDITGTGGIPSANLTGTINIARLADNSITNAKLANQSITINGSAVSLGGSVTVGETKPTISSISPSTITNAQTSIAITGSNFTSVPQVEFLNPSTGIWYTADTITFNNSTSLTVQATLSVDAQYKIRIENPDGNSVLSSTNILTVSDAPTWTTSAGSLGTFAGDFSGTLATVVATSDSAVTFSEVGSNLTTANVTLSSAGVLSTTDFGGASTQATTYNFTIRATDAEGQTTDRSFSLTSSYVVTGGGQFN